MDYHIGLNATALDVSRLFRNALSKRNLLTGDNLPVIRTDNGPQFMAVKFEETCQELKLVHERIPVKTPNMNAHIEAFHSILEEECYGLNEFLNFKEAYEIISQYIEYYNNRKYKKAWDILLLLLIMSFIGIKLFRFKLLKKIYL